ncbi:MAG TPA: bifunctional UDP-N-acetylglucosamine diphosphorylase/glucosamine-1-phosphate N-acetyltransferase GlmU [Rhodanobacteraceae bacterium]|jgi:bifunctional UDP-N-acetylglucosamine pyrophosphorylase/glucosamine-1-phosphate N-acetyltransferase|nr:bifunctional UDP-N-acetylglucosamine diphosphorylase/glucosamine-1-phosphate N-acetyltransferase GlmU [Rhodanobacteraceae bacterium]
MADPLHVIVLAAGEGKRMKSRLPKVLLPLAGKPMLAHVLETARGLRPAGLHVVYGHRGEQVRAAFALDTDIHWVHQSEQRGTGHAVRLALHDIPEPARVLVLYGDMPLLRVETLVELVATHADLAVLAAEIADPTGYARVLRDGLGRVRAVIADRDLDESQGGLRVTNTGVTYGESPPLRDWVERLVPDARHGELNLAGVFELAAEDGNPADVVMTTDTMEAFGVNDATQLAELGTYLRQRDARRLMLEGVRIADPARFDLRGHFSHGRDVEIDVDVILEGGVTLGDGVKIGPFCRLRNVNLAAGSEVRAHCDLEGVTSYGACTIGPFARLRPGTELASGTHIGNFVETKKARLGEGSKANHLTYLGDAKVGAGVNIGAGTITCNFDGVNKHLTEIGDGAFIGSNSSLVAPVRVGDHATIGAGSTITADAPADKLTVARGKQSTVRGWKRPSKDDLRK